MSNSKDYTKIILIAFTVFIVHIFLFNVSNSYANIFRVIKYGENTEKIIDEKSKYLAEIKAKENEANVELPIINNFENTKNDEILTQDIYPNYGEELTTINLNSSNNTVDNIDNNVTQKPNRSLNTTQNYILNRFLNYNLWKQKTASNVIFSLTDEFPFDFTEYKSYNTQLSLYLFNEGSYDQIFDVFDVISYDGTFKLRKVNNFGQSSFYINIDEKYNDNIVRIVFLYENNIFGLKLKKDLYNDVKQILLTL